MSRRAARRHRRGTGPGPIALVSPAETLKWAGRFFHGDGNYACRRYYRARRHRHAGGHGLPAEFKIGGGVTGQGTRCRGRQGIRCHGVHRGFHGGADRLSRFCWEVLMTCGPVILWSMSTSCPGRRSRCTILIFPSCGSRGRSYSPGPRGGSRTRWSTPRIRCPFRAGTGAFVATSNGLASGNHLLEAISHAICETVERDAATLHERPGASRKGCAADRPADRATIPAAVRHSTGLTGQACRWTIWEITTDIGIPVFRSRIAEGHRRPVLMTA